MILVLDTHAMSWYCERSKRLSSAARKAIADLDNRLVVPAIAYAEAQHQFEHGTYTSAAGSYMSQLRANYEVALAPLDEAVLVLKPAGLELHDALVVATALRVKLAYPLGDVRVVTCDAAITACGLIRILW